MQPVIETAFRAGEALSEVQWTDLVQLCFVTGQLGRVERLLMTRRNELRAQVLISRASNHRRML